MRAGIASGMGEEVGRGMTGGGLLVDGALALVFVACIRAALQVFSHCLVLRLADFDGSGDIERRATILLVDLEEEESGADTKEKGLGGSRDELKACMADLVRLGETTGNGGSSSAWTWPAAEQAGHEGRIHLGVARRLGKSGSSAEPLIHVVLGEKKERERGEGNELRRDK